MNRKNLTIFVSLLILVIALAGALLILQTRERLILRSPMLSQDPSIITYMEGLVEISVGAEDSMEWVPAEIGTRLREGDSIRTGTEGLADIRIHDGGVIRLLEETQISLTDLTIRRQTIDIATGTLFAKFRLLFETQDLRFASPDAVAAVRGTELVFEVSPEGTRIDALSGITEVINPEFPEERILLAFQKSAMVSPGFPPGDPRDMVPRQIAEYRMEFNGINHEEVFLISQDIRFEANRALILSESMGSLDEVARLLKLRRVNILIAGHTADVGATIGQVKLSEERAEAIMTELISRGIPARRLSTIGYGGSRPVGDNLSAEGRATNRRVEFLVVE